MNTNLLASRAMLVTLNTGRWGASRQHAEETKAENTRHGTDDVAKVMVKLTNHPALSALGKLHAEARKQHYRLTLPCADDGFRFLPCGRELEHSRIMQDYEGKHTKLVNEFMPEYGIEKFTAPTRLNGLYKAEMWPEEDVVRVRFKFTTRYLPVPDKGTWQEWLSESAKEGQEELRDRLKKALRAMVNSLGNEDATFRDTLTGNLHELCSLAPDLNLTDDPVIAKAVAQASPLAKLPPQTLRENKALRQDTAKQAANILAALGGKI